MVLYLVVLVGSSAITKDFESTTNISEERAKDWKEGYVVTVEVDNIVIVSTYITCFQTIFEQQMKEAEKEVKKNKKNTAGKKQKNRINKCIKKYEDHRK